MVDLEARPGPPDPPAPSTQVELDVLMIGSACLLEARPGPAAARRHRGLAPPVSSTPEVRRHHRPPAPRPGPLWSLRHYANPSNNERPGPQPHKQTLNNVRTRPVVQCLPMGRCAYPRLGLLVWAVHPIRRHYTPSVRVHRHVTGVVPRVWLRPLLWLGLSLSGVTPLRWVLHLEGFEFFGPFVVRGLF